MTAHSVEMSQVGFAYEQRKFQFDLAVEAGETLAVIGASGSGKSTLLALLAGFLEPTSGTIRAEGVLLNKLPPAQRPFSMIFQDHNLFPHLDIQTNVGLGIDPSARLNSGQIEQVNAALSDVGLSGFGTRMPGELSGGERQRVALARSIVQDRPVLLLDEALTALGPAMRSDMLERLSAISKDRGKTIIMVTHSPEDAREIAGRTAFIADGKVAHIGKTADILRRPDLADYLGTVSA